MGKKGSWFSAIKRAFTPNSSSSKDKQITGTEKKTYQEKKKGRRILKHGEFKSFIPLFREPSSIEKILEEADQQKLLVPFYSEQQIFASTRPKSPSITSPRTSSCRAASPGNSPPRAASPRVVSPTTIGPLKVNSTQAASPRVTSPQPASPRETSPKTAPPRVTSPRVASSKVNQNQNKTSCSHRPEPTLQVLHLSAIRIQATFRGYVARKSFRALRGLLRLQGVVKANNVKRQMGNAMKQMQLMVRVQTQVRSRRNQMMEDQALQWEVYKNDNNGESTLSKWSQLSESGNNENWDNSTLTKDEVDQRWRRKVEAAVKRERAMAYSYSRKLRKANPKSILDIQSNGFPWWWKWLEHRLPSTNCSESQYEAKNVQQTTPRAISESKPSPLLQTSNYRYPYSECGSLEPETPTSTKSLVPSRAKPFHTPSRTPPKTILRKYACSRGSATGSAFEFSLKDDDSLTSCPPFSTPNYMAPTISAKAKVRPSTNPREGNSGTPSSYSKRRLSFPLTPNTGYFKWNKWSSKDAVSLRGELDRSEDGMSMNSTVSMPAIFGRRPFNRFV